MFAISRRRLLSAAGLGLLGGVSGLGTRLTQAIAQAPPEKRRHCILLWMSGGPSQTDTFDMKPGHANGGEFKEAATQTPGLQFSEHLPKLAQWSQRLAVVRSLSTKEGDHGRGAYLMRTGHQPQGPVNYPGLGSLLSKELGRADDAVPQNVAISPFRAFNQAAFGPGFLGPKFAPLTVAAADNAQQAEAVTAGFADLRVDDLSPPAGVLSAQVAARQAFWKSLQTSFLAERPSPAGVAQNTAYERAQRLIGSGAAEAFDLSQEPDSVREAYGKGRFGQGCLMARRLIERGVSFVEVSLGATAGNPLGWDTHQNNFTAVKTLSAELDAGWATLMTELHDRGLLDRTTILWLGEFGRTPKINPQGGRDHFPAAWSCVLAGGGIQGGQAYGKTDASGETVEEGKLDIGDLLATLCTALGVDPARENISPLRRPIPIAEGRVIKELLG